MFGIITMVAHHLTPWKNLLNSPNKLKSLTWEMFLVKNSLN